MFKHIRILVFILILTMLVASFAACNDTVEAENSDSSLGETEATEKATVEIPSFEETGILAVFVNDDYTLRVIRSEYADTIDKDAYTDLRNMLKSRTGKAPRTHTDFVGAYDEKYDGPAILLGDTDYEESKALNASLKNNQYAAKLIGNKYVISFKCLQGYEEVLKKIRTKIRSCPSDYITIDESWNIEGTLDNVSFVPDIDGGWDSSFDGGQGSTYCMKEDISAEEYDAYIEILKGNGFEPYFENEINGCAFDLLYTESSIAYAMYFANDNIFKLSMDPRDTFALPTLEAENVYEKTTQATITQVGLGDSINNGMLYISKMSDGSFIIIDGGLSASYIYDSLTELAGTTQGIRVAAWLITHHHNDHAEGFLKTAQRHADKLIVEKVIHCQPRADQLRPGEGSDYEQVKDRIVNAIAYFKATNPSLEEIKAHPGMEIYVRDAKFTVLATIDTVEPKIISNVNNASMVFRMQVGEKSTIFLGDSEQLQTKAMYAMFGEDNFRCDGLQLAHHGYGNTNTGNDQHIINEASNATMVFCPVSTYHYNGGSANVKKMPQNALFIDNPDVDLHIGGEDNVTLDLYTYEQIGERWEP